MTKRTKITSSGIIRNSEKPRTGIVSANSLNPDFLDDFITQGIDLGFEEFLKETTERLKEENPELDDSKLERLIERETDCFSSDGNSYLLGAWVKSENGQYEIDRSGKHGDFAAMYSSGSNNVSVEWSILVTPCHNTSPCYIMADGSGPCGDLDTKGDSVIAYTLPADCFSRENDNGN